MNAASRHQPYKLPEQHPSEDLVATYASGALDEASALAIASHLTLCPACRAAAAQYEVLGGELIDDLPAAPLSDSALAATLSRARATAHSEPMAHPRTAISGPGIFPAPLRRYVGGDVDAVRWRSIAPGIQHMPLLKSGSVTARLLRIAPGRSVFDHSHGGTELTLVLNGSYTSEGQRYRRGDIEVADETVNHRPIAGSEDACICLAVTDAPLRFGNWIGRLMQPFIGI